MTTLTSELFADLVGKARKMISDGRLVSEIIGPLSEHLRILGIPDYADQAEEIIRAAQMPIAETLEETKLTAPLAAEKRPQPVVPINNEPGTDITPTKVQEPVAAAVVDDRPEWPGLPQTVEELDAIDILGDIDRNTILKMQTEAVGFLNAGKSLQETTDELVKGWEDVTEEQMTMIALQAEELRKKMVTQAQTKDEIPKPEAPKAESVQTVPVQEPAPIQSPVAPPEPVVPNAVEIQRTLRLLHGRGEIVELRSFGTPQKTWSGYYDNSTEMTNDATNLSGRVSTPNTYHTLQLINPALLARRTNGMMGWMKDGDTTADGDGLGYRWLPLDQDPIRPSGISSSDPEKTLALGVTNKVVAFLAENGVECVLADSGNGYHVLVRIDLPVTDKAFVEELLKTFAAVFSSNGVVIDTKNFNPSRIWKLYGTPARKGSNLPERPWRISKLLNVPEGIEGRPVSKEKLQELLAKLRTIKPVVSSAGSGASVSSTITPEMVETEAERVGVKLGARKEYPFDGQTGLKWQMVCPFNPEHKSPDAWLGLTAKGELIFSCSHNSCQPYGTNAFRQKVGGFVFEKKAAGTGKRKMSLVKANTRTPKNLKWAWQGRIFANKPNVFYGEGGLGKGFIGTDYVAHVTTGRDFFDAPNLNPICDVIICCTEDSWDETLVPRLMVAGADLDHVHFMMIEEESAESIEEGLMALDIDLPKLAGLVEDLKKNCAEKVIITIDPLATYMGELDSNKDKECRPIYTKMATFCEKHDVCMLLIAHPNKNEEASAINRLSGAKCLTTVFRNTWLVEKHPDVKGHVLMMRSKGNLAKEAPALEFHIENIEDTGISADDGKTIRDMGRLVWDKATDHIADEVLQAAAHGGKDYAKKKEEQNTVELLKEFLANGPQKAEDFYNKAALLGLSEWAVRKAKTILKLKWLRIINTTYWARTDEELVAKRAEIFRSTQVSLSNQPQK